MAVVAGVRGNSSNHGLGVVGPSAGGPVALLGSSHVPRGVPLKGLEAALSILLPVEHGLGCGARCTARRCAWVLLVLHIRGRS